MRKLAWTVSAAVALVAAGLLTPQPSSAVVVLDSTWREEGGARGREPDGFGAHIRLANEPQFRPVVTLSNDGGEEWGVGSGTWIGNDDSHGYILTSAHNFDDAELSEMLFRTGAGTVLRGNRVWIHPGYSTEGDHTGVDLAIVRLVRPVTDAGPAPLLYAGTAEKGQTITFVGYGTRGIGSVGENERYNRGTDKAAAQGVVDEAVPLRRGSAKAEDPGNFLSVFLPRENGSVENPISGAKRPVSRLAGLLGAGDSGGSAWMPLGGGWVVVGVNTSGDGKAQYGDSSWFARVSGVRPWIASIFPGARFTVNGETAPMVASAVAKVEPSVAEPAVAAVPGLPADSCRGRERLWARSGGAWYAARAMRPGGRPGSCLVHFDDYSDDDDEEIGLRRLRRWSAEGPGTPVTECRRRDKVLAEEDGVWYPAVIRDSARKGCVVSFRDADEDDEDEIIPLRRLRTLRAPAAQ